MVINILLWIPIAIFILAGAGALLNIRLAQNAAKGKNIPLWKVSCFLTSIIKWAIIWLILDFVLLLLWLAEVFNNNLSTTLLSGFVVGPLAGYIVMKGGKIIDDYWGAIAQSLSDCDCLNSNQASIFNHERPVIESGKRRDRPIALNKVLFPEDAVTEIQNFPSESGDENL